MSTIDDLLAALPGDAPVQRVLIGAFWTVVVVRTDRGPRCGLASAMRPAEHHGGFPVRAAGDLGNSKKITIPVESRAKCVRAYTDVSHGNCLSFSSWLASTFCPSWLLAGRSGTDLKTGKALARHSALELASLLRSDSLLEASVGLATVNALLPVDEARCTETNAQDIVLERGAGRRVVVVGHFPFVPRLRRMAAHCDVLELCPRPGDLPANAAARVLPRADVVALTSTSLINHTFDDLLSLCRPDAFVVMMGPSTPLWPELFAWGVDALAGSQVTDIETVLRVAGQGATFRQLKRSGIRLITMLGGQTVGVDKPEDGNV